jgi:serine/threonine protein kinase
LTIAMNKEGYLNAVFNDAGKWLFSPKDSDGQRRINSTPNTFAIIAGSHAVADFAGRSVASTAIYTPGFAAPEQFTSAKQGPWTDIYGLSATLYNAIVGKKPPSAFDRML